MSAKSNPHFNVYDPSQALRRQLDQACQARDLSRSQLVRHALRAYLKEDNQP
jgi:hypothetical protein